MRLNFVLAAIDAPTSTRGRTLVAPAPGTAWWYLPPPFLPTTAHLRAFGT